MASKFLPTTTRLASYLRIRGFATVMKDLKYASSHEWVKVEGDNHIVTIGITDHAQKQIGNVIYVHLPDKWLELERGSSFGRLETLKSITYINSPVSGKVVVVNRELTDSPGLINGSPYEKGWMIKVEMSNGDEVESLMDHEHYSKLCEEEDAK